MHLPLAIHLIRDFNQITCHPASCSPLPPSRLLPLEAEWIWACCWNTQGTVEEALTFQCDRHLGSPIHSQLPAVGRRDFSPANFKASYLFRAFSAIQIQACFVSLFHSHSLLTVESSVFKVSLLAGFTLHLIAFLFLAYPLVSVRAGFLSLHQPCNTSSKLWYVSTPSTTWLDIAGFFFFQRLHTHLYPYNKKKLRLGVQVGGKTINCTVLWF